MKLYYFPVAPNPTKVLVYLGEKGLLAEGAAARAGLTLVRVSLLEGEQKKPEHLARHPQGKLPVLEMDDGSYLIESLPIIEYLEERFPDPVMIGSTPEERARVRSLERQVDLGVLVAGGRAVHTTNSPLGLPPNPPVAEYHEQIARESLERLDALLADRPFVAGSRVTIADCTLWAALGFMRFFGVQVDSGLAHLERWHKEFGARPSTIAPD